jgi:superfamily II DNA or RNA helicase
MRTEFKIGEWVWLAEDASPCRVVEIDNLWDSQVISIWHPVRDTVLRTRPEGLLPLHSPPGRSTSEHLSYVAAAARIAHALETDSLVAPLEGTLIPLPHQLQTLSRALSGEGVRYLLADEVGLGKTIEAGMVLRELKIRGMVRRCLVIAPAGLTRQWVSELDTHFNETFRFLSPANFRLIRELNHLDEDRNIWTLNDQIVCSIDSVKPIESRRGWSQEQVDRYNRERFEDLVSAGWDLVIIDEAHKLAGSTDRVARYRLGEALSQAAPYLLLLSATPHQGKTDAFIRLLSFIDEDAFPDEDSVNRENVKPYVIRTEKRGAIDIDGNPLFKPRHTRLVSVPWGEEHQSQLALYEAVTEYVMKGYNKAVEEKKTYLGFLMVLYQRLVSSSTCAIRSALERRLDVLDLPLKQLSFFPEELDDDWENLESQEQMDMILKSRLQGMQDEQEEVKLLLAAARRVEALGPDAKAMKLYDTIHEIQREENAPEVKILVFTEFISTQKMLASFLSDRGFAVVTLNGNLGMDERIEVQKNFAEEAQIMISTDAGGEGLNLQFCHVVVNYDVPWNPMKIEQRIGRVDRIGQEHEVQARNFVLENTVEYRVREVLEEKLYRIREEFGVDKLSDVLDSEEGGADFESIYLDSYLDPEKLEERVAEMTDRLKEHLRQAQDGASLLGGPAELDPGPARKVAGSQIPYWTERMTLAYLASREEFGAQVAADEPGHLLTWPDGSKTERAVFTREEAKQPGTTLLSIEHPQIRNLLKVLPPFAPGQTIPSISIPQLSSQIAGTWSLWRVSLQARGRQQLRFLPLFLATDGGVLLPTSRAIWERLIDHDISEFKMPAAAADREQGHQFYRELRQLAEEQGQEVFAELTAEHQAAIEREERKTRRAYEAHRKAITRIGLPEVRNYRLAELEREHTEQTRSLAENAAALPELTCLLVVKVEGSGGTA